MMGVNNIDRESPKHAGQFDDQQRIQHAKLAEGRSGPEVPVAGQLGGPVNMQGGTGRSSSQMIGDHVDLVPDLGEGLGHPENPNRRASGVRKGARCNHRDAVQMGHTAVFEVRTSVSLSDEVRNHFPVGCEDRIQ